MTTDGTSIGLVLGIVGLLTALVEIIRYLICYVLKKKNKECPILTTDQKQKMTEIHATAAKTLDIISKVDKDGTYLCYFPRNYMELYSSLVKDMGNLQKEQYKLLADITAKQERITDLLDRIERRLDAHSLS